MNPIASVALRPVLWSDLPEIVRLSAAPCARALAARFLRTLLECETLGVVGLAGDQVVGFALCEVLRRGFPPPRGPLASLKHLVRETVGARQPCHRHLRLFGLGVAAEWRRSMLESLLLARLTSEFPAPRDHLEVPVPEDNLPAQRVLKMLGFVASSVLPRHYGDRDAYLMVPTGTVTAAAGPPAPPPPDDTLPDDEELDAASGKYPRECGDPDD